MLGQETNYLINSKQEGKVELFESCSFFFNVLQIVKDNYYRYF